MDSPLERQRLTHPGRLVARDNPNHLFMDIVNNKQIIRFAKALTDTYGTSFQVPLYQMEAEIGGFSRPTIRNYLKILTENGCLERTMTCRKYGAMYRVKTNKMNKLLNT